MFLHVQKMINGRLAVIGELPAPGAIIGLIDDAVLPMALGSRSRQE